MNKLVEFLNGYSGFLMAILTLVYVVFTIKISKANSDLIRMMKEEREKMERPYIQIRTFDRDFITCLLIKNIGRSPAKDVKFEIDKDMKRFGNEENLSSLPLFKKGVIFFPAEYEYQIDLGQTMLFFEKEVEGKKPTSVLPSVFKIKCSYWFGDKKFEEETIIDMMPSLYTNKVQNEIAREIKELQEEISKKMEKIESTFKGFFNSFKQK